MSMLLALIGGLGTTELLLILGIVVIVFGVGKLPEVGKHLGRGIRNFKSEMNSIKEDVQIEDQSTPAELDRSSTDERNRA